MPWASGLSSYNYPASAWRPNIADCRGGITGGAPTVTREVKWEEVSGQPDYLRTYRTLEHTGTVHLACSPPVDAGLPAWCCDPIGGRARGVMNQPASEYSTSLQSMATRKLMEIRNKKREAKILSPVGNAKSSARRVTLQPSRMQSSGYVWGAFRELCSPCQLVAFRSLKLISISTLNLC